MALWGALKHFPHVCIYPYMWYLYNTLAQAAQKKGSNSISEYTLTSFLFVQGKPTVFVRSLFHKPPIHPSIHPSIWFHKLFTTLDDQNHNSRSRSRFRSHSSLNFSFEYTLDFRTNQNLPIFILLQKIARINLHFISFHSIHFMFHAFKCWLVLTNIIYKILNSLRIF